MCFPTEARRTSTLTKKSEHGMSTDLLDYVVVIEDALKAEFCDQVVGEYLHSSEWELAQVGFTATVVSTQRNAQVIQLSHKESIQKNKVTRSAIDQTLFKSSLAAVRQYQKVFPHCRLTEGAGFQLLRYQTGGFYRTHTDSFQRAPRMLACSFALNDDFEGGRWSFLGGAKELSAPKGSAVLFPSNFMFPHEIQTITAGTRYSIITWMT
jgi:predicted 2-oxoglutarate/Fe(II)-dependent dioxygenase YbiX